MPPLFVYLLKVNLALVLFYLAYRFLLRQLTFYTLNRAYLLVAIAFSATYPFVDISDFLGQQPRISARLVTIATEWQPERVETDYRPGIRTATERPFNYWAIPAVIFWLGATTMALRLASQLAALYFLHRRSLPTHTGGRRFRRINDAVNPFSFLRTTYVNPAVLKPVELTAVLEHEWVHVKEWHTIDVLLAELNVVFYWFNPGAWLLRGAIKENLEFIADRRVLRQGAEPVDYQHSLVRIATLKRSSPIVNYFSLVTIKRRIIMINKTNSPLISKARYLVALPVAISLAFLFTASKAQLKQSSFVTKRVSIIPEIIPEKRGQVPRQATALLRVSPGQEQWDVRAAMAGAVSLTAADSLKFSKYLLKGKPADFLVDGKPMSRDDAGRDYPVISRVISYQLSPDAAARILGPAYAAARAPFLVFTYRNRKSSEALALESQVSPSEDAEVEIRYDEGGRMYTYGKPVGRKSAGYLKFAEQHPLSLANGASFDWVNDGGRTLYFVDGKEASESEVAKLTASQVQQVMIASSWTTADVTRKRLAEERNRSSRKFPITVNSEEELRNLVRVSDLLGEFTFEINYRETVLPARLIFNERTNGIVMVTRKN